MTSKPQTLSDDLLIGAEAIASYLYGRADVPHVRRVRHLIRTSRLPTFRMGRSLAARKSELNAALSANTAT